jgi:hypothetical protein
MKTVLSVNITRILFSYQFAIRRCANPNSAHKDPILSFRLTVLRACYQVALDAKGRYRIGGGQITPRGAPT